MSNKLILIFLLLFMLSCNKDRFSKDTTLFNNYLESKIHTSIPADTTYFVVISQYGCEGCIARSIRVLKNNPKVIFLIDNNTYYKYVEQVNLPKNKYLVDTTGTLLRLKFHKHNVGIVKCADKHIYDVINMTYNQTDSVLATIR